MSTHDPIDAVAQELTDGQTAGANRLEKTAEDDLKWLMSDKRGRRIVWRFLSDAGVYRSSFATNALVMAHREGERQVGLTLLQAVCSLCPSQYARMTAENSN